MRIQDRDVKTLFQLCSWTLTREWRRRFAALQLHASPCLLARLPMPRTHLLTLALLLSRLALIIEHGLRPVLRWHRNLEQSCNGVTFSLSERSLLFGAE